jgi:hypothetical protein
MFSEEGYYGGVSYDEHVMLEMLSVFYVLELVDFDNELSVGDCVEKARIYVVRRS